MKKKDSPKSNRRGECKRKLVKLLSLIFNPHLLLCFGLGWMITNGWAYIFVGVGTFLSSPWMISVGTVYLTALWFPFTPEKIVTLAIAIWLLTLLFPNDKRTLAVLREEMQKVKNSLKRKKDTKQDTDDKTP